MNPIGIFAKTFARPSLESTLGAIVAHGFDCMQFNMVCAGLPTLPAHVEPEVLDAIIRAIRQRGLQVAALSGTFNILDADRARRSENLRRLEVLADVANALACPLITLCSGTRDQDDMWRAHPDNAGGDAWCEMVESIQVALSLTGRHGVSLGVEPEPGNVVRSAREARRLLDELRSARLRVVMDGANIIAGDPHGDHGALLAEAFSLLGPDIAVVHAKELPFDTESRLDWDAYLSLIAGSGYQGPIIMHGFAEAQVVPALDQIHRAAARAFGQSQTRRDIVVR